ncbi:MAG: hypothetical protein R3321_03455 [Nitrososphaeraceae archaeon]|nr:hypothetical protein [Nitrososphaeraceae archaeon]
MGAVYRPKDINWYSKIIGNSLKDLNPDIKDDVLKLLSSSYDENSERKLREKLGDTKTEKLLSEIKKNINLLNEKERDNLKSIFKDSLTFD